MKSVRLKVKKRSSQESIQKRGPVDEVETFTRKVQKNKQKSKQENKHGNKLKTNIK